jgi:hypothetical protein
MKIIAIILAIWLGWLGYQYVTKSGRAAVIIQQKMEEIDALDTDILLNKIGRLPEYQEITVDNNKYGVRWGIYGQVDWTASEGIREVEARGKVEFIELFPFSNVMVGYPFKLTIRIKGA